MTYSRLCKECRKCKLKKTCQFKRLEMIATMDNRDTLCCENQMQLSQPYTPIVIRMGECGNIHTSKEEILKQIGERIRNSFTEAFNE